MMCQHFISIRILLIAIVSVVFLGIVTQVAVAAPNQQINYQGKITDNTGVAVTDGTYDIVFNLYTAPTGGPSLYTETTTVEVVNGLFSIMVGSTTPLSTVDFNQTLFLGVNFDSDGEMVPRKILGTVPAAFEADRLDGIEADSFLRSDANDIATGSISFTGTTTFATSTFVVASTTELRVGGDSFTSLLGSGLVNQSSALAVLINESNLNIDVAPTDGFVLQASSTAAGGFEWQATTSLGFNDHDSVTLVGEDYLTLSGQEITANAIDADNLSASDFGDFTCNGTTCSLDANTVEDNEINFAAVTLADFTDDVGFLTDITGESFLDLLDTPATFNANRLLFTNAAGDALTDDADLTFDGEILTIDGFTARLLVSTSTPGGVGTLAEFIDNSSGTAVNNATKLFIDHAGATALQLAGNNAGNVDIQLGSPTDALGALLRWNHDADEFRLGSVNPGASVRIDSGNAVEAIRIDSAGNVGIGTTTPTSKLTVAGSLLISTSTDGTDPALQVDTASGRVAIGTSTDTTTATFSVRGSQEVIQGQLVGVGSIVDGENGADVLSGARDVKVVDNYAYVVSVEGFQILDISDPTNPAAIGAVADGENGATVLFFSEAVEVFGNYAYVASFFDSGLQILDISDPTNPVGVGSIVDGENGADELFRPADLAVVGSYAYVLTNDGNSVQVIDVSDPTNPTGVGSITDGTNGADRLNSGQTIKVFGSYAYIASGEGVQILDISDPTNPVGIGSIADGENGADDLASPTDLAVFGIYAYVTAGTDDSLQILDISDPTNPVGVGSIADGINGATALNGASGISISGEYAYVSSSEGVQVIHIGSSTNPIGISAISDEENGADTLSNANDIFISGNYAYVASAGDSGLQIIDLGGVTTPTAEIGSLLANRLDTDEFVARSGSFSTSLNVGTDALINGALTIHGTASSSQLTSNTNPSLIVTSGNVGIGTTTPSQLLTVAGNARITGALFDTNNTSGTNGQILQTTGAGTGWVSTSTLGFFTAADIDTEVELETLLTDVANVFTNNDIITTANIADSFVLNTGDEITGDLTFQNSSILFGGSGSNALPGAGITFGVGGETSNEVIFGSLTGYSVVFDTNNNDSLSKFGIYNHATTGAALFAVTDEGDLSATGVTTLATTSISILSLGTPLVATSGGTGLSTIAENQLLIGSAGNTWTQIATTSLGFNDHDSVTLVGEDYLTLSGQEITANAIDADNLSASDFGDFTCNGTTCSLDANTVEDNEINFAAVTLADFTDDVGFLTDITGESFLDLLDTPATFNANRLLFTNSGGTALTDSADLTFTGTELSVGGSINVADDNEGYEIDGSRVLHENIINDMLAVGINAAGSASTTLSLRSVAVGQAALFGNVEGIDNTAVGFNAGLNTTSSNNSFFGRSAGSSNTTGSSNTFLGRLAGQLNIDGNNNTAVGALASLQNIDGSNNTAVGFGANRFSTSSTQVTAVGTQALSGNTNYVAERNTALGFQAGLNITTGADNNVLIGFQAGDNITTGANNIVLGYDIDLQDSTQSNTLNIGNILFGTGIDGTEGALSSGNIGIGTTTPLSKLHVESALNGIGVYGASGVAPSVTSALTVSGEFTPVGGVYGLNIQPSLGNGTAGEFAGVYLKPIVPTGINVNGDAVAALYIDTIDDSGGGGAGRYAIFSTSTDDSFFGGNVGIGDASPASLFTVGNGDLFQVNSSGDIVTQSVGVDALESEDFGDFTCNGTTCSLDANTVEDNEINFAAVTLADFTDDVGFLTDITGESFLDLLDTPASYTANRLFFTNSGGSAVTTDADLVFDGNNLGIKETNPQAELHVARATGALMPTISAATAAIFAGTSNQNGSANVSIISGNSAFSVLNFGDKEDEDIGSIFYDHDENKLSFITAGAGAASGVNIDAGGRVGIGTLTPFTDSLLTVDGNILPAADDVYDLGTSTMRWRDLYLGPSSLHVGVDGNEGIISYDTANNFLSLDPDADAVGELVVKDDGSVGIGTTTPTAGLHVDTSVRMSAFGLGTVITDINGNFSVSSDERLKDILGEYTRGIDEVLLLEPISYNWNDISGLDTEYNYAGFSAQNVQEALPEAVAENRDGYLTLQDRPIIAALVNAVKEIWEVVTGNQDKIAELEARLEALENQQSAAANNTESNNNEDDSGGGSDSEPVESEPEIEESDIEETGSSTPASNDNQEESATSTEETSEESGAPPVEEESPGDTEQPESEVAEEDLVPAVEPEEDIEPEPEEEPEPEIEEVAEEVVEPAPETTADG